jgi:histidine triad (HIT) family protein
MATIFTKIINGDIPSYKIAESDECFAFLDINPLAKGHALVVPKTEEDYIFDVDDESYKALFLFAKKVGRAIESVIPCKRMGMIVFGLDVPHAHIHLIPINKSSEMNLSSPKIKLGNDEFIEIARMISDTFENQ